MPGSSRERSSVKARAGQSQADRRAIAMQRQKAKRREGVDEARQMGIEEGGDGAARVMQGQPLASEAAAPEPPGGGDHVQRCVASRRGVFSLANVGCSSFPWEPNRLSSLNSHCLESHLLPP